MTRNSHLCSLFSWQCPGLDKVLHEAEVPLAQSMERDQPGTKIITEKRINPDGSATVTETRIVSGAPQQ